MEFKLLYLFVLQWYNSHLGTLFPFGEDCAVRYERVVVPTSNCSDEINLDFYPCQPLKTTRVNLIVFFPGLGLTSINVS